MHKEPKTNRTVGQLLDFDSQIKRSLQDVFTLMDNSKLSKIREFYNNEGGRLTTWNKALSDLAKEYFVMENDEIVMEETASDLVDAGGNQFNAGKPARKPKMLEGKTFEDYINKRNAILDTQIPCTI